MPDRRTIRGALSGVRSRVSLPLETTLSDAKHPICVVGRRGTISAMNEAWASLVRELDSGAELARPYDLPIEGSLRNELCQRVALVASGRESLAPVRGRLVGREEAWMEVSATPVRYAGEPHALVQHWWVTSEARSERRRRMSAAAVAGSLLDGAAVARNLAHAAGWTALQLFVDAGQAALEGVDGRVSLPASHAFVRAAAGAAPVWLPLGPEAEPGLPAGTHAVCVCPASTTDAFVLCSPFASRPDDETLALVRQWLCVQAPPARSVPSNHVLIDRAAGSDATVLLLGESGTGKTRLARAIHDRSARASRPFLDLNCAGLSVGLLESELFGHERGAFTGAHQRKRGLLELAEGGTVLLDEIGELDPIVQAKLLKVLETRVFRRVGGEAPIAVDVRFLGATNRDLRGEVRAGRFRGDLYYRLAVVEIRLPPLRERSEEIGSIAAELLGGFGNLPLRLSEGARQELSSRDWPGNVRELRNALERASLLARDGWIDVEEVRAATHRSTAPPAQDLLDDHNWRHVTSVLESTGYNVRRAAGLLGVARSTLYEWARRRGIDLKTHRQSAEEKGS